MKIFFTTYVLLFIVILAGHAIAQDSSLIAFWSFDDSTAFDSSAYQNHGTLHGVTLAENRFGEMNKAFYFDGIDDYISIDSYNNMSPATDVSVAVWLKTVDTLEARALIYDRLETQDGFGLVINDTGFPRLSINGGSASCTAIDEVDDQQWHHIVATYSTINGKLVIYVDAVLSDTTLYSDSIDYSPEPRNQIGRTLTGVDYFNGVIDEIRIYNRELQEADVLALYNNYTSVEELESGVITDYVLSQNYPNPFNPSTTIRWQMPEAGNVTIKIYDVLGREIKSLLNEELAVGEYEFIFDGANLSSGVYFYQLKAGSFIETKKMILLR